MPKILIGQADSAAASQIVGLFNPSTYKVQVAVRGDTILDTMKNGQSADIVILDQSIRDPDAVDICRTIKGSPEHCLTPVLILANEKSPEDLSLAIEAGCDDILLHPILPKVLFARVLSLLRIKFLVAELDHAENVLYTLARTIEAKDRYTMGHGDRVAIFAKELGKALGVSSEEIETLRKGGMLHDVGKIAIPDAILMKPGKFTVDEFNIMKKHPTLGCDICEKLRSVREAVPLIRHHHERLDGSGYPDGLSGEKISPLVRVMSIVDVYDALRSKRSYKDAFSIDKTFEIMWEEVNKGWWDKNILTVWEKIVRSRNADPFPV
jgi:putative two-component system response regulator